MRALTPLEARVLGVLVEKQATVPDTYPLSLNALVAGCNQKTARDPVVNATDAEVLTAIDGLKSLSLVFEGSGSRVVRFEHNLGRVYRVPAGAQALLTTLLLRGAQTSAELRLHSERLYKFADISSVEGFLDELAARDPPLALRLPRAPGAREARWAHLLCGEVAVDAGAAPAGEAGVSAGEIAALKAEQARLAGQLERLQQWAQRVGAELGIEPP
ncbi:MAG: YceH family protein [Proteobacteria bacterium]|nr:YceH family protein [Pseudomonadota bacterium]